MFNEIIINKQNLINNVRQVRLNNPNSMVCAMVKAIKDHVDYFGVACLFEAKRVRRFTNLPILIVGPLERKKPDDRFIYTCHSLDDVLFLAKYNIEINIHLKLNTGMNRFGFCDINEFTETLEIIKSSKLKLIGLFTHFATCDNMVEVQFKKFKKFIKTIKEYNENIIIHTDNSEVNKIYNHNLDMVRIGFDLYYGRTYNFKPIVEIKSKVVQINIVKKGEMIGYSSRCVVDKKTIVAVIPIGYADGFDMSYIGKYVYIKDKPCKVLNICMDCFMLDVSKVDIKKGDEIYILNRFNSIDSYADYSNTIEYEVMTKFSNLRARRKFN